MKVAIVNTYDTEGGAARAAARLHEAFLDAGVSCEMFVQFRSGSRAGVNGPTGNWSRMRGRLRWQADHVAAQIVGAQRGQFSVNVLRGQLLQQIKAFAPDVVHLHWVNAGFVSLGEVSSLNKPVFWTAHDMWPFTGGCHYDRQCGRFVSDSCLPCPMQQRWPAAPLARQRLAAKARIGQGSQIHFVAPSRWMASIAKRSPVGRDRPVTVIPNGIDLNRYRAIDRSAARKLFGLPAEGIVLLFGGALSDTDPRKGFHLLDAALASLAKSWSAGPISLCVFGSAQRSTGHLHGLPVFNVGHLHDDESIVALYSASDVFVAPSLQDNLPNTIMEAAACGVPTVAFDIGGISDLVEHGVSGWLAAANDVDSLARALMAALSDTQLLVKAGQAARRHAEREYSYARLVESHLSLYEQAMSRNTA